MSDQKDKGPVGGVRPVEVESSGHLSASHRLIIVDLALNPGRLSMTRRL